MPVYIIQIGEDGPCKIGHARNVASRLNQLQLDSTHPLRLRRVLVGTTEDERRIHRHFADLRLEREWYMPSEEMLMGDLGSRDITALPREWLAPCRRSPETAGARWSAAFMAWLERIGHAPDELARILGVRLSTFENWIQSGSIPDRQVRERLIEISRGHLAPHLGPMKYDVMPRRPRPTTGSVPEHAA